MLLKQREFCEVLYNKVGQFFKCIVRLYFMITNCSLSLHFKTYQINIPVLNLNLSELDYITTLKFVEVNFKLLLLQKLWAEQKVEKVHLFPEH